MAFGRALAIVDAGAMTMTTNPKHTLQCLFALCLACAPLAGCDDEDDDDEAVPCAGSGGDGDGDGDQPVVAALEDVCALDAGPFSLDIDNPFFPLEVGSLHVLEGDEAGTALRVEIRVLDETEDIGDVTTRVIEETEYEDGELIEVSRNWFAQAQDGTVCYFGEEVDIYEGGEVVAHEGAWRAGEDGARAGIIMPAAPELGMSYAQEIAADQDAWDHASHVAEGETITVPEGEYTDTVRTIEWSPIEPDEISRKVYAAGVGMIIDNAIELTERSME